MPPFSSASAKPSFSRPAAGKNVTRLTVEGQKHGWGAILERLPTLGYVMALTRNEHCVHERKGRYREVGIFGTMGSVVGPDIDLRFFLNRWHSGFAMREESAHGPRESLQFFDRDGTAVHKVYLQAESDRAAFETLVADFRSPDQGAEQSRRAVARARRGQGGCGSRCRRLCRGLAGDGGYA